MGANINKLPPPWPNAAQALSRVAADAQLRERVQQASDNAPIKSVNDLNVVNEQSPGAPADSAISQSANGDGKKLDINV